MTVGTQRPALPTAPAHVAPSGTAASVGAQWAAAIAVLLVAARTTVLGGRVEPGLVVAAALLPVWWRHARRWAGWAWVATIVPLAVVSGLWLTEYASQSGPTSSKLEIANTALGLELVLGTGVVLWCREVLGSPRTAVIFGVGLLLAGNGAAFRDGTWRFGFETPVTVIVLALAWWSGSRAVQIVTILALAALSATSGARSTSAILVLALVLTIVQWLPRASTARGSRLRVAGFAILLVAALYNVGLTLILDGYLGDSAQERTQLQIDQSGSVLLGARPEMGATAALFVHHPVGFGSGTLPTSSIVMVAKSGMAQLGYNPDNGYVEHYMFGNAIVLHSNVGDFWALFGIPGIVLAGTILVLVLSGYVRYLANRHAVALLTYMTVRTVWNVFFSPSYTSVPFAVLALGLLMWPRRAALSSTDHTSPVPGPGWWTARREQIH
ncbi:hypothetical protein [Cellulomonas sp. HZM]|uniref:hypothetical protein n=1 Tax=Cellulomonas sp. HZM TaxID=1454010 RepID=UPI0006922145|nr:hypothetical protein [Cellulomonas sp. HZM]